MANQYQKSLDDELDWTLVNQYHAAVLQISQKSFEIKKLTIVTLAAVLTFISKLSEYRIDSPFFVSAYLIIILFWFLNSYTYYFQIKLRIKISEHLKNIKLRNAKNVTDLSNVYVIEPERIKKSFLRKSILNRSMWIYYILLLLNTLFLIYHLT